ncbi:MAG: lipoyl synthase [Acidobacteria bacterium]|nr:lipoyl synthase [Acidobacteriota bacterium]
MSGKSTASPAPRTGRPAWLRVQIPHGDTYFRLKRLLRRQDLHTVCESANCPNIGECWSRGTATIMILGNICTRSCGFCDVRTGRPFAVDPGEPGRVAETVHTMGLRYAVITSVDRDDLEDGGAAIWAATIREVKKRNPDCPVEALIGDFRGSEPCLETVLAAAPDVLAHNVETVPRLHPAVRPQGKYRRALELLGRARRAGFITKTSLILGLGEREEEIIEVLEDLRGVDCQILTLGQYLRPSPEHLPIEKYYRPEEFDRLGAAARAMGFPHVASGPLVRSSYLAETHFDRLKTSRGSAPDPIGSAQQYHGSVR